MLPGRLDQSFGSFIGLLSEVVSLIAAVDLTGDLTKGLRTATQVITPEVAPPGLERMDGGLQTWQVWEVFMVFLQ